MKKSVINAHLNTLFFYSIVKFRDKKPPENRMSIGFIINSSLGAYVTHIDEFPVKFEMIRIYP